MLEHYSRNTGITTVLAMFGVCQLNAYMYIDVGMCMLLCGLTNIILSY